jgi:hypothetical protein
VNVPDRQARHIRLDAPEMGTCLWQLWDFGRCKYINRRQNGSLLAFPPYVFLVVSMFSPLRPERFTREAYACALVEFVGLWNGVPQFDSGTFESREVCQKWADQIEPLRVCDSFSWLGATT